MAASRSTRNPARIRARHTKLGTSESIRLGDHKSDGEPLATWRSTGEPMAEIPENYRVLDGSELSLPRGARRIGQVDPGETITVSVCIRHRPDGPPLPDHNHWLATPPRKRTFLSSEEFASRHGAAQPDLMRSLGLRVVTGWKFRRSPLSGVLSSCQALLNR